MVTGHEGDRGMRSLRKEILELETRVVSTNEKSKRVGRCSKSRD